jgi:radical SAM superfamily enzyme YgiQ (UPF0313 family)
VPGGVSARASLNIDPMRATSAYLAFARSASEKSYPHRLGLLKEEGERMQRRIQKIVFVEPKAPGYHVYSRVALPRLGLPLLASIAKHSLGYDDVSIYCEDIAPIDMKEVLSADLVGVSTTTSTAQAAYDLCDEVRRNGKPGAITMLGGVHVTFMSEEAAEHADFVVKGEGEGVLVDLITAIENGVEKDLPPILGAKLRDNFAQKIDSSRSFQDIDSLPFPELNLIKGHEKIRIAPVVTSRGCPFDCTFCSVIEMFSQKMRYHEFDQTYALLKKYQAEGRKQVFFYDDNFNAHNKRTKELLEGMIRNKCVPDGWTAQVRATEIVRDRELLELMKRTNCFMVYLGLESVNPATLKEYNKKQSVEQIVEAIRILKEYGILAHGMFVFGADGDTIDSLRMTADFAIKNKISTVQFMILTPLPGTRLFKSLHDQGRIFDYDWSRYDAHHTVYYPRNMSPRELQVETFKAMERVYTVPQILRPLVEGNTLTPLFRLYGHRLIKRHNKNTERYVALLPTATIPESDWKPVTGPEAPVAESARSAQGQLVNVEPGTAMPRRRDVETLVAAGGVKTHTVGAV